MMLNAQGKTNPQSVEAHGGFDEAIYDAVCTTKPASWQVEIGLIKFAGDIRIEQETVAPDELLSKPTIREKKDGAAWIPATFREGGKRCKADVLTITALVYDFDSGTISMEEALRCVEGLQASTHTTHSHTLERPKFRLVIYLSHPIPKERFAAVWQAMAGRFPAGAVDVSCKDSARLYYLPAAPEARAHLFEYLKQEGAPFNWEEVASGGHAEKLLQGFGIAPNITKSSVFADIDRAKLSEALPFIEPEPYENWLKVGMALHPLGDEGFQMWDSWSAQSPKYPGQNELRGKWDSFKDGEGVGFGTVFHLAKQNGFVINPPAPSTGDTPQILHVIPFDIPKVFTELAVAEAVHKAFGLLLRYVPQTGKWHVVDEHNVWREDLTGKVDRCVVAVLKESKKYVCTLIMNGGNDKVNSMLREINKAEKYGFTVGTVSHLRSLEGMTMNSCHFDADPLLVGLAGGQVLDLRTSTVRPLLPEDYISKTLGTCFDAAATCPRWIQFIDEVTCGDKELAIYLQVVAGYCLSGLNELHVFWLMVGSGRNGKTVLLNVLMELLAEYAVMLPAEAITLRSNGGDNLSDLARLDRNRLAVTSEIAEGSHYNENRLKGLSGGDRITARRLYSEPYDFENRAKVLQAANYRPIVKGTDAAIWDRLQMVPFNAYFDKPDRQLTDKLKSELSGILNWCVDGWKIYQVKGLEIPAAVANESNAYKQEQDLTGQFLDQTCKVVVGSKIKSSELYARFKTWCLDNGFYVPNSSTFGRRIGNRLKSKREASGVFYLDVRMY